MAAPTVAGIEAKPLPYLLCEMNLLFHGIEYPDIDPGNALRFPLREIGDRDRVDVIMTNPPFGGEEERGILSNFPEDKQTSETALLYLQLIMRKLRRIRANSAKGGRAAVVVPDGTLSGAGIAVAIRRELLQDYNLYAIVQLPPGSFSPYAETARTNILFFECGSPTSSIWYCQVPPPNGRKQCSKNNPLSGDDFKPVHECWLGRRESTHAWTVKRADIDTVSCDLLRRNPTLANARTDLNIAAVVQNAAMAVR